MTLTNTTETYQSLQPFFTINELNDNTKLIRERHAKDLTRSTYRVLDVLHRYSSKYYGVSYRSKSKIAVELGISRKTVTRACQQLESLGIIQQHELKRHNGDRRRSSNAIVFIRLEPSKIENVPTECPKEETPLNTNNNPKITLDTKRGFRGDKIPAFIYDALSPFLSESAMYKAYSALLRGKAAIDRTITFESNEGLFTDAILSVINGYKRGVVRSISAVLYTVAFDTAAQIYRKENYKVPDWLEIATH
nr:helix-turn-helix domain-containing protein [Sporosarcina sp.]QJS06545.1 DeoR family transcriptional regulator [Sporosarcina sp.]